MSTITSDQSTFEATYGAAGATISFATLLGAQRRVDALRYGQLLHPTLPALPMIQKITGTQIIDVYSHAFDIDAWEMGSTNSTLRSRRPIVRWNYDLSVEKLPDYTYLWFISPVAEPFSLLTTSGFYGVIPDSSSEFVFFFSNTMGVYSLSYDYANGGGAPAGDLWQGSAMTWQGEAVTW